MKSGFVTIAGMPNVGKSTLLNTLLKHKVAITSPKPQTTRDNINGILNGDDFQIVFIDTPGIHDGKKIFNKIIVNRALEALKDIDAVIHIIDGDAYRKTGKIDKIDFEIAEIIKKSGTNAIMAINKIDKFRNKGYIIEIITHFKDKYDYKHYFPISAFTGDGVDELLKAVIELLPEGERFYDEDILTDKSLRFHVAELIREKAFLLLKQELPYSTAVVIDKYEEGEELDKIYATIMVERNSQKGIVIGKGGLMLKKIGTLARKDIEDLVGKKVYLELHVKVFENWTKNEFKLKQLGFKK